MRSATEIMRERAAGVVRDLLVRAPANSVRSAFAAGSVGRDEVWSETRDGVLHIYSDIDLYVVLTDGIAEGAVRRHAALISAAVANADSGVVFHRGVDIGVYRFDDLLAQPSRPGTIDLADHHVWLYGDRAIVDGLRRAMDRPIAASEALYLLENRAWDALAPGEGVPGRVTAAKVVLDVLAAHLIAEGRFRPTQAARFSALAERRPERMSSRALEAIAVAGRIRQGDAAATLASRDALALVGEAWCALAPAILARGPNDAARLLSVRCARGARTANVREFVRWRHHTGLSLVAAVAAAWAHADLSPVAALRTHALSRGLVESGAASSEALQFHTHYVERLSSRLVGGSGSLDDRARLALRVGR